MFLCRLPGLESSTVNKAEEDAMYDEMMLSLLKIVTKPLRHVGPPIEPTEAVGCTNMLRESSPYVHDSPPDPINKQQHGFWMQVHGPSPVTFGAKDLWRNLLNWRAFTLKNRLKVMV
jgi:hypothetical protein